MLTPDLSCLGKGILFVALSASVLGLVFNAVGIITAGHSLLLSAGKRYHCRMPDRQQIVS
jgi:hypothetical protein